MYLNILLRTDRLRSAGRPSSYSTPAAPPSPPKPAIFKRSSSSSWAMVFLSAGKSVGFSLTRQPAHDGRQVELTVKEPELELVGLGESQRTGEGRSRTLGGQCGGGKEGGTASWRARDGTSLAGLSTMLPASQSGASMVPSCSLAAIPGIKGRVLALNVTSQYMPA